MLCTDSLRRLRVAVPALALCLVLGLAIVPPAPAQAQTAPTTVASPRGASAATPSSADVSPLAEAYVLLADHYAVPVDPAQLVSAGEAGMAAALHDAGVDVSATDAPNYGSSEVEEFASLQDNFQTLAAQHGDAVPTRALADAAIAGMADSLDDAHTTFLSPQDYQEELRWERGDAQYAGIGVRLHGPQAVIQEVFPGSPAEQAGLQPGDTIVAVNGELTDGMKLDDLIKLVRGTEGTPLVLGVQRATTGRIDAITLTRAQVMAPVVSSRLLPGNVGYVQLRGFPALDVVSQVERAILQQQQAGVRGIVLDLRGNAGGRIAAGEELLADFVPNGPIYQSVDRDGHRDVHNVQHAHPILSVPLVVLVDAGTASMGEIFAAAIQEHHVGQVVGETTAGAVAASRIIPLSDGSALQFSVERVYSGAGALLDHVGVHPDDEVALDLDALRQQGRDTQLDRAVSDLAASPGAGPTTATGAAPIRIDAPAAP